MATKEKKTELIKQRRCRKGAMTRLLNTLKTVIEGEDPNSDTVEELLSKSQEGFTAIEAIHEELMNTAEDEEVESLEAWMEECHTSFWKVRSSANKYLASKSEGNHNSNNDVTAEISSPRSTADSSSLKNFNEIKLALELPKAEFTEFDGNPVDFYAFLSKFETNVESKLSNNATRLQYLLQMCKGKARCSIECCALLGDDGYVQAKSILSRQFGQPHMILNALMNELLNKKPLKPNDAGSLWDLIASMKKCHVTLTQIGYTSDLNSTTSLLKIQSLLPTYLQTAWAKKAHEILYDDRKAREPEFVDMLKFLEWHAEISCTMFGRSVSKPQVSNDRFKNKASVKSNNVSSIPFKCYLCEGNHSIYTCSKLIEAAYEEKLKMVKAAKLCFRCLRPGHGALKCRKNWTCRSCGSSRHHNKLHPPPKEESKSPAEQQVMSNAASNGNRVYLRILPVVVTTHNGYQVSTLALLDHGSDTSLCSESFRKKLKVRGKRVKYTSSTINGDEEREGFKFDVSVKGKHEKQGMTIDFLSVPKIPAAAESVPRAEDLSKWRHLESLPWENQQSDEVGLLIGTDAPEAFWVLEERKGKPKEPYAMRTMLGWSIMGPGGSGNNRVTSHRIEVSNEQLFQEVEKSWAVENTGLSEEKDSIQDIRAREIMKSTIKLTKDGHYEMGLLWKHDNHDLPHSRSMAESRLASLKRRLESNKEMHGKYTEVVEGYIAKGFAEPVNTRESKPDKIWYLPHHPVVHPHKKKVRVVYDCAAKSQGTSLNDKLLKGPDLMNNLLGVLLRFRQEKIAIVSDIEAMFHQVQMIEQDRDALRFLWWEGGDMSKSPKEYRMCVHLFGATSSPCCAGKALKQTAEDNEIDNQDEVGQRAIDIIRNGFYVDDCLGSVSNQEFAIQVVKRLVNILSKGGFRLTKWLSNDRQVLQSIEASERAPSVSVSLDNLPTERTLGVSWDAENDLFAFQVLLKEKPLTRRGLLSITSSFYDPLGFAAPFILVAKSLLQEVCKRGADWDEPLTDREHEVWQRWLNNTSNLSKVTIPRWLKLDVAVDVQLHIFCDASEKGYAAVAYLRTQSAEDVSCRFVVGKARVSPLKSVSIPRLELMSAVLAATLDGAIRREMRYEFGETIFWSDSMIVLNYLRNESTRFKTFVANRVAKIRSVSKPHQWRHVGTKDNPADEGSRGTFHIRKWLTGPDFLTKDKVCWPESKFEDVDLTEDPEVKRSNTVQRAKVLQTNVTEDDNSLLTILVGKYSSWTRLVRVLSWIRRFIRSARNKAKNEPIVTGNLIVSEIKESEKTILLWEQKRSFPNLQRDPQLKGLNPMLENQLLRVGGRLNNAQIDYEAMHQVILPSKGDVVRLLVEHYHTVVGHSGWAATINALREKFWIIKGKCTIKRILRSCVICKKCNARPVQQIMAPLPSERVTGNRPPFTFTGVDYFGPIDVKQGRSTVKRYGCIFTCLATRAVHLEVADCLDSDSFINAYRRFVARRGQVEKMFSDNGTNFVAGERELREALRKMNQDKVEEFMHTRQCEWHFNPPSASHFGGVWERLIRSVRRILHGILREQTVNSEVLHTVLVEAESILNSRPLTDISPNSDDEEPLTPNHLLLLRKGPEAPIGSVEPYSKKRWLQAQYLASLFWTRWRREYLPLLQKRHKWTIPKQNVKVNDVVLLVDASIPRSPDIRIRYTNQIYESDIRIQIYEYRCTNNQIYEYSDTNIQMYRYTDIQIYRFADSDSDLQMIVQITD
ncbi:hypothetical protein HOLleu_44328 [Holothuria leucospilota]|uniref:Integrase catalytic domain-containing protein n=2 Tax=Holothuria leucospilota TaxID=206669 RepID=A0A9Q0YAJ7_HOLLE|nr:hypothetical protein HOLleu_44328 [Holothuria leucospilota]